MDEIRSRFERCVWCARMVEDVIGVGGVVSSLESFHFSLPFLAWAIVLFASIGRLCVLLPDIQRCYFASISPASVFIIFVGLEKGAFFYGRRLGPWRVKGA